MTDDSIKDTTYLKLIEMLEEDAHTYGGASFAVAAIRQLMKERDEAFQEGQRDMQFAAAKMTNDPAIFAKIYDLQILTRPLKRS